MLPDKSEPLCIEWRVVSRSPHAGYNDVVTPCRDEEFAREYAEAEAADYPHHLVWVESRYVTPWMRSGGFAAPSKPATTGKEA